MPGLSVADDGESRSGGEAPCPASADELLGRFSALSGLEAEFVEERRLRILTRPLESAGKVYFAAPKLFARYVERPASSALIVDGQRARVRTGDDWETFPLGSASLARGIVDGFLHVLRGDGAALRESFELEYGPADSSSARWRLILRPKVAPLTGFLEKLVFEGSGARVMLTRFQEIDGDETVTRYRSHHLPRSFTAEEKQRIFQLTAP